MNSESVPAAWMEGTQVVLHRYERPPRLVSVKVEKNSRGVNWEISTSAPTPEEALALIDETFRQLEERYGE